MKQPIAISHEFVEYIPEELQARTLYISIPYSTAVHKCFCGCGREVVTPLGPTDWQLTFDGQAVSLSPSVGSWSLPCRSHYWIRRDRVEWAALWSRNQIEAARTQDRLAKREYFGDGGQPQSEGKQETTRHRWWDVLKRWWS